MAYDDGEPGMHHKVGEHRAAVLGFGQVDQTVGKDAWAEMDRTARADGETWD